MAIYSLSPQPWLILLDDLGVIVPDGQLAVYDAGTTTPATVYKTSSGTAHTFPIDLDAAGRVPMALYLVPGQSYKFSFYGPSTLIDLDGDLIKTQDNIAATPLSAANQDVPGILGDTIAAGALVYLSDGSGGKVAGRWYPADTAETYSSTTPGMGFAIAGGLIGDPDTIRTGGVAPQAGPLTPGALYFASASPGVITATMPATNTRLVGQADTTTSIVVFPNPPTGQSGGSNGDTILGVQIFS